MVQLKTDVPIENDLDDFILEPQDGPRLIAFLKAMGFATLTRRVAEATACDAAVIDVLDIDVEWEKSGYERDSNFKRAERESLHDFSENSPQRLAQKRQDQALSQKITRDTYTTIFDEKTLKEWLSQAQEQGFSLLIPKQPLLIPYKQNLLVFRWHYNRKKQPMYPLNMLKGKMIF